MGPMTGRGAGYCAGYDMPGHAHRAFGRGFGMGWGGGFGRGHHWRHWHHARCVPGWSPAAWYGPYAPAPEQEVEALKGQAQWLKEQLDAINKRLEEIEKGD
jgi:hypothetical protein